MEKETSIKLFEEKKVRSVWNSEQEKWYISIVDVIEILTESNPLENHPDIDSLREKMFGKKCEYVLSSCLRCNINADVVNECYCGEN